MACAFCATGKEGLTRNLTAGEIVDQIVTVQRLMGRRVTNVVGMGQGLSLIHILPQQSFPCVDVLFFELSLAR